MQQVFDAIKKQNFLVLGRAGMDMFATPVGTKSEIAETFQADIGGSSANICVGLVKLGARAALATTVSDDAVGRFCLNKLKDYGVDTRFVTRTGGEARTSLAIYESCIEDFQNVIYRNGAADFEVTTADMDALPYGDFAALIVTGTVFAAEPSRSATFHALAKARAAGLPVIFDIDYRPYSWPSAEVAARVLHDAGKLSDAIIGNDEEFGFMAGDYNQGLHRARELADKGKLVIYKKGAAGAITFADKDIIKTGIYPVEAIKPNGAGDSFMAGFLTSLGQGFPLRQAILRGSAAASIVVSKPGCAPAMPTPDILENFMETHTATDAANDAENENS